MNKSNSISEERLHLHSLYYPSKDLDGLFAAASGYLKELENYKKQEEDGLLLRLPCALGTPLYYIEKGCDCDHYKDEFKVSGEFDKMCPHYHPNFYEQVEYCDCQEDGEGYCSLNLEMYCNRCKERLIIRKEPFELKHINRVYGTEQFDKNTALRDVRFLTSADADDFIEELKKQKTKY